jgi:hypothetical protein
MIIIRKTCIHLHIHPKTLFIMLQIKHTIYTDNIPSIKQSKYRLSLSKIKK